MNKFKEVLISSHKALIGAVPSNLRGLTIDLLNDNLVWRSYFNQYPTDEEREVLSVACTEVLADCPFISTVNEELLIIPSPEHIEKLKEWVYKKWETEKEAEVRDYKGNDDLRLYDSVIEGFTINHKSKTIEFKLLVVKEAIERNEGNNFTYIVNHGLLSFKGVIYSDFTYRLEWDEWAEFYRTAVLKHSKLLDSRPNAVMKDKQLQHIYLGIDCGNDYKEIDIVCEGYSLMLEDEDLILHDDFDWLYED